MTFVYMSNDMWHGVVAGGRVCGFLEDFWNFWGKFLGFFFANLVENFPNKGCPSLHLDVQIFRTDPENRRTNHVRNFRTGLVQQNWSLADPPPGRSNRYLRPRARLQGWP